MKVRGEEGGNWKFQQGKGIRRYYGFITRSRPLFAAKRDRDSTVTTGRLWHRVGPDSLAVDAVENRGPSDGLPLFSLLEIIVFLLPFIR